MRVSVDWASLAARWRRAFGRRTGAVFRARVSGEELHLAEGEIDALALALRCSGTVVATGGTSGLSNVLGLVGDYRSVVLHADHDPGGERAAVRALAALRGVGLKARVRWFSDDPAAAVAEQSS